MAGNIVSKIPNLLQGVSTQSPEIRALGQVEQQDNFVASLTKGLIRRPGAKHKFKIDPDGLGIAKYHHYVRGDSEYTVCVRTDGKIKILNRAGVPVAVYTTDTGSTTTYDWVDPSFADGSTVAGYLSSNIEDDTKFHTMADSTFLLNTAKTTQKTLNSPVTQTDHWEYVYVKKVTYGRRYKVHKHLSTGVIASLAEVTFPTAETLASGEVRLENTPSVRNLTHSIMSSMGAPDSVIGTLNDKIILMGENTIAYWCLAGETLSIDDDSGGSDAVIIQKSVTNIEDLPAGVVDVGAQTSTTYGDMRTIITINNSGSQDDDVFVKPAYSFTDSLPSTLSAYTNYVGTTGVGSAEDVFYYSIQDHTDGWEETCKYGEWYKPHPQTMPLQIFEESLWKFRVKQPDWGVRNAGDDYTNKDPLFYDKPITALGSYQDRLVLLAGNTVSASRSGEYFDFYKESVATDNPSNPVRISTAGTQAGNSMSSLQHLAYLGEDLMVTSNDIQYMISGSTPFTQDSPLVPISQYPSTSVVSPVTVGQQILLPSIVGSSTTINAFTLRDNAPPLVSDITAHIQGFILPNIQQVVVNHQQDKIIVLGYDSATESDVLYLYQTYIDSRGTTLQKAWSRQFMTGMHCRYMWISNDSIFIVVDKQVQYLDGAGLPSAESQTIVLEVSFSSAYTLDNGYPINLDHYTQFNVTSPSGMYHHKDVGIDYTKMVGIKKTGNNSGMLLRITPLSNGGCSIHTDDQQFVESGDSIIIGEPYDSVVDPGKLFVRQTNGTVRTTNRTELKRMFVHYKDTGAFEVDVTDRHGNTTTKIFEQDILGYGGVWDEFVTHTGVQKFGLRGDNSGISIQLKSHDHYPVAITSLTHTARYGKRVKA